MKIIILFFLMAGLAAVWGCGPGGEVERKKTMKGTGAVHSKRERPPIDREQPAKFETATFALG